MVFKVEVTALKTATICLDCECSRKTQFSLKIHYLFIYLPIFSQYVLNRCLPETEDRQAQSFFSDSGLSDFFQVFF